MIEAADKTDINDLLVADGPTAVQAAKAQAKRAVHGHATPTKSARAGASIELHKTIVAQGTWTSRQLFRSGYVLSSRDDSAEAVRLMHDIAQQDPSARSAIGAPKILDRTWIDRHATRVHACGLGNESLRDGRNDQMVRRRPCHAHGCWCMARRGHARTYAALTRLSRTPGGAHYRVVHAVAPIGAPRPRGSLPDHAHLLMGDAPAKFDALRTAPSVNGCLAWARSESLYGPWAACVIAIVVTTDIESVAKQLGSGWFCRDLGLVAHESRRGLAGWLASYGAIGIAAEMSIHDRARCLLDVYAHDLRHSFVRGVLHGSALNALETKTVTVNANIDGPDDSLWAPPPRCPCGQLLVREGECHHDDSRAQGWTPRKRHRLALPDGTPGPRWLTRREAAEAAAARHVGEAFASLTSTTTPGAKK